MFKYSGIIQKFITLSINNNVMNIGATIKRIRKGLGMKQGVMAKSISVTQGYLSKVEKGQKTPSLEVLREISKSLGYPLPILMYKSLEESDIIPEKREYFKLIKPAIDSFIDSIVEVRKPK